MATAAQHKETVDAYLAACRRGDAAAVIALFSDDAVIEDPIGAPPRTGRELLTEFYAIPRDVRMLRRIGPLTAYADYVAVQFRARLGPGRQVGQSDGGDVELSITEVFTFDGDGKILRMVAYPDLDSGNESTEGRTFE